MYDDIPLRQAVLDELAWSPAVTSSDIVVTAKDGIVTLSGSVASFWEKRAAEHAALSVRGVNGIAEEIKVELTTGHMISDEKIAQRIVSSLEYDVSVPDDHVKVKVESGWVTLTGEVNWNYQKTAAENAIIKIAGLSGLTNSIAVKPHVQPYDVRAKIIKALERAAPFSVENITISAEGGNVTLGGKVLNRYEHDVAVLAAWAVPGVAQVSDDIDITSVY